MPRVDIVQKHNSAARRLYIRGHNGKVLVLLSHFGCLLPSEVGNLVLHKGQSHGGVTFSYMAPTGPEKFRNWKQCFPGREKSLRQ